MDEIKIVVIEDNRLLRDSITNIIKKEPDLKFIASCENIEKIEGKISELKPDVLIFDFCSSNKDSSTSLKSLKLQYPEVKLIVMDIIPIQEDILNFVESGISGFILKDATREIFLKTIRSVAQGEKVLPDILMGALFSQIVTNGISNRGKSRLIKSDRMTKREREITASIADGLTNKEIADNLHLSISTVKSHVHNILEKMSLSSRVQIAIYANSSADFNPIAN
jgi:DNA-binding NarL/FixJ family response regulator